MTRHESESDSETSDGQPTATSTRFRVKVNMKRFFDDERALAYVCVRPRHRVRWLQQRLVARFRLPPRLLLLSRGHLLPPAESLAVLHPDDPVDVLPCPPHSDTTAPPVENTRIVSPDPHADVLDAGVVNFISSAEVPERDEDDELVARKLRALRMLEQYSGERIECESIERSVSRPRRRRVRRRRRPAPYCVDAETPAAKHDRHDQAPAAEHDREDQAPAAEHDREDQPPAAEHDRDDEPPAAEHDALQVSSDSLRTVSVLRNGSQKTRIPRVVRALGDEVFL